MSKSGHLRLNQTVGFSNLLKYCWFMWKTQHDEKLKKTAEEESIYDFKKTSSIISASDEAKEQKTLNDMFPSYNVMDKESDEGAVVAGDRSPDQQSLVLGDSELSLEELHQVCSLHLAIFGDMSKERVFQDHHQPPLETYQLASYLVHSLQNPPGNFFVIALHTDYCCH